MCGVAGILSLDGSPVQHTSLKAMTEALRHRGPDEGAVILLGDEDGVPRDATGRDTRRGTTRPATRIGLGHRRLKVIDLSGAAAQPMRHAGGAWLVYNGEIYNAPDLRADLQARGARFRSRSDTEVVLEALCAWGSAALPRLNGMFAVAFWDPRGGGSSWRVIGSARSRCTTHGRAGCCCSLPSWAPCCGTARCR